MIRSQQRGHAVVEVSLMVPWIFFLFVGTLDFGFFNYAIIATQNAARIAALHTSSDPAAVSDSQTACELVKVELAKMPNSGSFPLTCNALPLIVTASQVNGADSVGGQPPVMATRVSVTYQTVPLVPIPGVLQGQLNITRRVEMRVE